MSAIDMSPQGIEARLIEVSSQSPLSLYPLPRVDMSPAAIESRLQEWAELTMLCLELGPRQHPNEPEPARR